jgi:hemerythrin-like domain-containing protein
MSIHSDPLMSGIQGIHRALTRALTVLIDESRQFGTDGRVELKRTEGFRMYARTFCDLLHAHHDGEEAIGFTHLRTNMSGEDLEGLEQEHGAMLDALHALQTYVAAPAPWDGVHWRGVHRAATTLQSLWEAHQRNEELYLEKASAGMTHEQRARLAHELETYGLTHAGPGNRVVPFILYNLEGKDRQAMGSRLPFFLKGVLVPFFWRADYRPMQPFLFPR